MSALERAKLDAKAGDYGTARQRLMSYVSTARYDNQVCEQIARYSLQMGDPTEAGRWYLVCTSDDAPASECIHRFLERFGRSRSQLVAALPRRLAAQIARGDAGDAVRQRIEKVAGKAPSWAPTAAPRHRAARDGLTALGCLLILGFVGCCAIFGFITLWGLFREAWGN